MMNDSFKPTLRQFFYEGKLIIRPFNLMAKMLRLKSTRR
jgi:hypothetical protein